MRAICPRSHIIPSPAVSRRLCNIAYSAFGFGFQPALAKSENRVNHRPLVDGQQHKRPFRVT